ncbi:O-antigen ligase family protein [uncultured Croceitalea sp.]|uniref:O-antigen ligase family protein n=1 Tax=uncultured Croceitalea sp. TaxID=1798908 RepID=UPI00330675BA
MFLVISTIINLDSIRGVSKKMILVILLFFTFFFIHIISAALNTYNLKEFIKVEKFVPFFIFPFVFLVAKDYFTEQSFIHKCQCTYFLAANLSVVILTLIAIKNTIVTSNIIYFTYNEFTNPLGIQPIYYGAFYCLALIFGFEILGIYKKYKRSIIIGMFLLSLAIILVASRTAWIILTIILIVRLIPILKKNIKIRYISSVVLLGIVLLVVNNPTLKNRLFYSNSNISSYSGLSFRLKIWQNSMELISKKPVLGYGPYDTQLELQNKFLKENFRRAYFLKLNSHNQYLQTALESGMLGLLCLILLLLLLLFHARADTNKLLFFILICLSLLTESYFRRFNGILFFCYFYFFFLFVDDTKRKLNKQ